LAAVGLQAAHQRRDDILRVACAATMRQTAAIAPLVDQVQAAGWRP